MCVHVCVYWCVPRCAPAGVCVCVCVCVSVVQAHITIHSKALCNRLVGIFLLNAGHMQYVCIIEGESSCLELIVIDLGGFLAPC